MSVGAVLRARAYAKVNLSLEVLGRREDGYHEIVSLVQTISLHDLLEGAPARGIDVQTKPPLVDPAENLVTRAAELLAAVAGRPVGADILIRKRIPLAAGLGGGSSDAATALRLLDRLWATDLPPDALARLAARLGSDVPLFLVGGTVLIRGRGEKVEPLAALAPFWLALACPPCPQANKTRTLYSALGPDDWSDGCRTLELADRLAAGASVGDAPLPNAFDRAASETYPGFPDLRRRLTAAAGRSLHLTGAGPGLFALFETRSAAAAAVRRMAQLGVPCHLARPCAGAHSHA